MKPPAKTVDTGKPCPRCKSTIRYARASGGCPTCHKAASRAQTARKVAARAAAKQAELDALRKLPPLPEGRIYCTRACGRCGSFVRFRHSSQTGPCANCADLRTAKRRAAKAEAIARHAANAETIDGPHERLAEAKARRELDARRDEEWKRGLRDRIQLLDLRSRLRSAAS